jgi:Flp pilus assembly protein CpaB
VSAQRPGFIFTAIGVLGSVLIGVMVYSRLSEAEAVRTSLPTLRVVVAATDIPPRTEISAAILAVQVIPDQLMQAAAR